MAPPEPPAAGVVTAPDVGDDEGAAAILAERGGALVGPRQDRGGVAVLGGGRGLDAVLVDDVVGEHVQPARAGPLDRLRAKEHERVVGVQQRLRRRAVARLDAALEGRGPVGEVVHQTSLKLRARWVRSIPTARAAMRKTYTRPTSSR